MRAGPAARRRARPACRARMGADGAVSRHRLNAYGRSTWRHGSAVRQRGPVRNHASPSPRPCGGAVRRRGSVGPSGRGPPRRKARASARALAKPARPRTAGAPPVRVGVLSLCRTADHGGRVSAKSVGVVRCSGLSACWRGCGAAPPGGWVNWCSRARPHPTDDVLSPPSNTTTITTTPPRHSSRHITPEKTRTIHPAHHPRSHPLPPKPPRRSLVPSRQLWRESFNLKQIQIANKIVTDASVS